MNIDRKLDLQGVVCPLNFVKTKLTLEGMQKGQILELVLDEGEPMKNVPRSVKEDGHKVLQVERQGKLFHVLVEKV